MAYNNPIAVAVGLIPVRQADRTLKLAGIWRGKASDDGYGKAALLSGYVDEGESIEEGIAREGKQELGFESQPSQWRLLHSRHIPRNNINLVFCLFKEVLEVDILKDAPLNEEVSGFLYIDTSTKLAFDLHEEAVRMFYSTYMAELPSKA